MLRFQSPDIPPRALSLVRRLQLGAMLTTTFACLAHQGAAPDVPVEPGEIDRSVHLEGEHRTVIIEMVPEALRQRHADQLQGPVINLPLATSSAAAPATAPDKPVHTLFWSITVYSDAPLCSVIENRAADGSGWTAVSGMDFRLLRSTASFSTEATEYHWLPAIADATPDETTRPVWGGLGTPERPTYRILTGRPPAEAAAALDYLHAHYAANLGELRTSYAARLSEEERLERELRENPPKRRDTIVRVSTPESQLR